MTEDTRRFHLRSSARSSRRKGCAQALYEATCFNLTCAQWRFVPRHLLPPFVANTLVGFSLFFTYTAAEAVLSLGLHPFPKNAEPFVAGACAGTAQAIISSPLDNVRMLMARRAVRVCPLSGDRDQLIFSSSAQTEGAGKFGWLTIMKEALFPVFIVGQPAGEQGSRFGQLRALKRWATRGWSLYALSVRSRPPHLFDNAQTQGYSSPATRSDSPCFSGSLRWVENMRNERASQSIKRSRARHGRRGSSGRRKRSADGEDGLARRLRRRFSWSAVSLLVLRTASSAEYARLFSVREVMLKQRQPFDVARREIWQGRMNWAKDHNIGSPSTPPIKPADATPLRSRLQRIFGSSFLKRRSTPKASLPDLPSARSLLREAIRRDGAARFFHRTDRNRTRLDSHPALGGTSVYGKSSAPTVASRLGKVFTVVPPYALGLLVYAVVSGDLTV